MPANGKNSSPPGIQRSPRETAEYQGGLCDGSPKRNAFQEDVFTIRICRLSPGKGQSALGLPSLCGRSRRMSIKVESHSAFSAGKDQSPMAGRCTKWNTCGCADSHSFMAYP